MERDCHMMNCNNEILNVTNDNNAYGCVKLGDTAPQFNATSTFGNISISDYAGKWLVFFSHPRRFYTGLHY